MEAHEKIEEAAHGHHQTPYSRRVAVLISALAALLAICEMGAKSAQTQYMAEHVEAANLWAFYQAKTIRMTLVKTAAESLEVQVDASERALQGMAKKVEKFSKDADRYNSEPETGEGRVQLAERAKAAQAKRDKALGAYHQFEYGSAALQLAIVLASSAVVTQIALFAFVALGFGGIGVVLAGLGFLAPTLLHF